MKVYLIRHGQTDANKNAIIQGRADNPLNETGRYQARKTGEYLKKLKIDFDYCVSSPLNRAIETTEIIKDTLGLEMKTYIEPGLIERDFGDYDGKNIEEGYFKAVHEGLIPGMERDDQIEKRVKSFFDQFFNTKKHQKVLMVAHSHVIKAILIQNIDEFDYDTFLTNCSVNILEYKEDIKVLDYNIDPLKEI
ncbi:MAG: histidine phosphatase family protein [Candidatus Izemoplasmatales bacterium]